MIHFIPRKKEEIVKFLNLCWRYGYRQILIYFDTDMELRRTHYWDYSSGYNNKIMKQVHFSKSKRNYCCQIYGGICAVFPLSFIDIPLLTDEVEFEDIETFLKMSTL